jgi:hypothetical protein
MSTFQNPVASSFHTQDSKIAAGKMNNPNVQTAENGAQDAMEFQLWVAKQSAQLSRLKVFASMAKSINDQQ